MFLILYCGDISITKDAWKLRLMDLFTPYFRPFPVERRWDWRHNGYFILFLGSMRASFGRVCRSKLNGKRNGGFNAFVSLCEISFCFCILSNASSIFILTRCRILKIFLNKIKTPFPISLRNLKIQLERSCFNLSSNTLHPSNIVSKER